MPQEDAFIHERWEALHRQPRFSPRYPHESAIRWTFRTFPRDAAARTRLLDLGCGTGRHALFFAREGYVASAADFSGPALDAAREWAAEAGARVEFEACSASRLPYADASFDGVLCFGVLCYLSPEDCRRAASEIRRVLKPGGKALVITRSTDDSRARTATHLGEGRYRLDRLGEGAPSDAELGMVLTLFDRREIELLFADFSEVSIDRSTITGGGGVWVDDDWLVYLTR